jgi:hypothetical protein
MDYCLFCGKRVDSNKWREHMKEHKAVLKESPVDKNGNWKLLKDNKLVID